MEKKETIIQQSAGSEHFEERHVVSPDAAEVREAEIRRTVEVVWYLTGFLEVLLALRILFLLLGARYNPFTMFLYAITAPFVLLFRGTLITPLVGRSYFDTSAAVAMVAFFFLAWGAVALVRLFRPTTRRQETIVRRSVEDDRAM